MNLTHFDRTFDDLSRNITDLQRGVSHLVQSDPVLTI